MMFGLGFKRSVWSRAIVQVMIEARTCTATGMHRDAAELYDRAAELARKAGKVGLARDCDIMAQTARILHVVGSPMR